ncbi:MAG: ATP-dependent helicase, partial [Papillibacter sp.]|nr:ATP-dependent helicase [Papillibacter sp.]
MIPTHLQQLPKKRDRYYGTLEPLKDNEGTVREWVIYGEPSVIEFAKRLFPGSEGRGPGRAKFANTKRIIEDLNWLMLKYPLHITDQDSWERSYIQAVDHALRIRDFNERPDKLLPPREFKGELTDFQKEGLSFLSNSERALLADEMGLGKTIQALALIAQKKGYPALIVVPPHLVLNWQKEINRFLELPGSEQASLLDDNPPDAVHIIKGLTPYDLPPANIYIIHYLLLRGWKNALTDYNFKILIFDEIQELRHPTTDKYSAASLLSSRTPIVIGLSGTPIYNRGGEIWSVLNIIEYHCLGDWDSFTREWCIGYGSDIVRNPDKLGEYLKQEGLMLRRRKEDVL